MYGSSWGTTLALEYYLKTKDPDLLSLTFQSPMFSEKDWMNDAKKLIKKLPEKYQTIIHTCHKINATDAKVYQEAIIEYYARYVLRDKKKLQKLLTMSNENGKKIYQYMWGDSEFRVTGTLKNYNRVLQSMRAMESEARVSIPR